MSDPVEARLEMILSALNVVNEFQKHLLSIYTDNIEAMREPINDEVRCQFGSVREIALECFEGIEKEEEFVKYFPDIRDDAMLSEVAACMWFIIKGLKLLADTVMPDDAGGASP